MVQIRLIPQKEFQRIRKAGIGKYDRLALLADMCRANTLSVVKRAGSGHLGSSFSAMDIVVWLYYEEMNTLAVGLDNPNRDIYFSSKGHDVPGLYSVLFSLGVIAQEKFLKLRRLGGLDGHPDVGIKGIEANSGSLGMGISKGRGMAWAKRLRGFGGRMFVLTGDGELQEGQNYEALHAAVQQGVSNLVVIVDHNKLQSDKPVCEIIDLHNLGEKFRCFNWHVARCDGHDFKEIERVLIEFEAINDRPKVLIADTIKGRGVSFMEHPSALEAGGGLYRWHAGAPDDESFLASYHEIVTSANARLNKLGLEPLFLLEVAKESATEAQALASLVGEPASKKREANITAGCGAAVSLVGEPASMGGVTKATGNITDEYVAEAFGQALVAIGADREDLVVLDADLAADCHIRVFEKAYPDRFIENGIAEQDMASMAGGLARQNLLPVVNSFASFLAARANEQIYNNASEKTKIIYACHYAGLIPAGPGKSHQSIRDISLFGALPNCVILQPCNATETRMAVEYCVYTATENCMLRLVIGPSPRKISLKKGYALTPGVGVALSEGRDALMFAYGPIMLHEALLASELLAEQGFGLRVVNMPWLNRVNRQWLREMVEPYESIHVVEDHSPVGGLGDFLLNVLMDEDLLNRRWVRKDGVKGFPACGTPPQALKHHGLDGASLAAKVMKYSDAA